MHPAYSVIAFTVASGAGYGLLFWLAILTVFDDLQPDRVLGLVGFGTAFALISVGLLCATVDLGRPERAWRAFSQWRTSWLSRTGVAAVATFLPFGLFALGWLYFGSTGGIWIFVALVTAAMCMVTVWCTGMIYQSMPTARTWRQPLVSPLYVALALATGAILTLFILSFLGHETEDFGWLTIVLIAGALLMKRVYWAMIDAEPRELATGDATGLDRFGEVRSLDPPHTQPNFVMREIDYVLARKHGATLRAIVQLVGMALPLAALGLSLTIGGVLTLPLRLIAMLSLAVGVLVERWLFFAEAQHVVTLYYDAKTA